MKGNFYNDFLVKTPYFSSTGRVSDIEYLEPATRYAVKCIMADAIAIGQPLILFETYRSENRQRFLFKQGVTQLSEVGCHHFGLAADLVKNINGQPSWDGDFTFLAQLAKKHGLISGLDWGAPNTQHSWIDACHVQRVRLSDQPKLLNATWYPDDDYHPYSVKAILDV